MKKSNHDNDFIGTNYTWMFEKERQKNVAGFSVNGICRMLKV